MIEKSVGEEKEFKEEPLGVVNVPSKELSEWINYYRERYDEVKAGEPGKDAFGNKVTGDVVGIYVRGRKDSKPSTLEAFFK